METTPRNPWWRQPRWRMAIVVYFILLPVAAVLSRGPAAYAVQRGWLSSVGVAAVYGPVDRRLPLFTAGPPVVSRLEGIGTITLPPVHPRNVRYYNYIVWWTELGDRHAGKSR